MGARVSYRPIQPSAPAVRIGASLSGKVILTEAANWNKLLVIKQGGGSACVVAHNLSNGNLVAAVLVFGYWFRRVYKRYQNQSRKSIITMEDAVFA